MKRRLIKTIESIVEMSVLLGLFLTFAIMAIRADAMEVETYDEVIEEAAEAYNLCPELIHAIIERESSYRPNASNGNCVGLMQINTKYHKGRMEKLGMSDMYDPKTNIWVGCDYIAELFEKYGEVVEVLMVYNMGGSGADLFERGHYSKYALGIVERTEELERKNGK